MITSIYRSKFLFFGFLFLQLTAHSQQKSDEAPPREFVAEIEELAMPGSQDTALERTVLTMNSKKYTIPVYELSKKFNGEVSGIAESTKKLNELIKAKPTTAYKILALLKSIRDSANYLCRNDFSFRAGQPPQNKIAYSWGSKDHTIKQRPPGSGDNCTYTIYGLDCSGFIYQLFKKNGIDLPVAQCNADMERTPSFLKRYLNAFLGKDSFEVKDLGTLLISDIQSGDIIYFKSTAGRVYHIGILFVNDSGEVVLYQSLGQPNRSFSNDKICQSNIDNSHGPVIKKINADFLKKCNNNYGCVRIVANETK